jgi:sugar lactone lactonase YvrE
VDRFVAAPCSRERMNLGESCRWDAVHNRLLWVDVFTGRLFCGRTTATGLDPTDVYRVHGHLTAVASLAHPGDGWIAAANQGFYHLAEDGTVTLLAEPEAGKDGRVRMNDGACDPAGRFWAGSMSYDGAPGAGSLYRHDGLSRYTRVVTDVTISNGLAWSLDGTTMYYVDSGPGTISAFSYDAATGVPASRRYLVGLEPGEGVPDGLCLDAEGCLWVAIWGGGQVRRYSPDGELIATVAVAATQPSSCALGGDDGRTLYITTAREGIGPDALTAQPDAGRLFCVEVTTPGPPAQPSLHTPPGP